MASQGSTSKRGMIGVMLGAGGDGGHAQLRPDQVPSGAFLSAAACCHSLALGTVWLGGCPALDAAHACLHWLGRRRGRWICKSRWAGGWTSSCTTLSAPPFPSPSRLFAAELRWCVRGRCIRSSGSAETQPATRQLNSGCVSLNAGPWAQAEHVPRALFPVSRPSFWFFAQMHE